MKSLSALIDFEAVKEPWNIYKLEDETILKTRLVLISVVMEGLDEFGNPRYGANSDSVIGVIVPDSLLGEPSHKRYTVKERMDALEKEMAFEPIQEEWNEYKLKDGTTMKMKLVLVKVARTSLRDERGQPLYLVNTQPLVDISIPRELREKLQSSRT